MRVYKTVTIYYKRNSDNHETRTESMKIETYHDILKKFGSLRKYIETFIHEPFKARVAY